MVGSIAGIAQAQRDQEATEAEQVAAAAKALGLAEAGAAQAEGLARSLLNGGTRHSAPKRRRNRKSFVNPLIPVNSDVTRPLTPRFL